MSMIISLFFACHLLDDALDSTPKLSITPEYMEETDLLISSTTELWSGQEYELAGNKFGAWLTTDFVQIVDVVRIDEPETALRLESLGGQLYYQMQLGKDLVERTQMQSFSLMLKQELNQRVVVPKEESVPAE